MNHPPPHIPLPIPAKEGNEKKEKKERVYGIFQKDCRLTTGITTAQKVNKEKRKRKTNKKQVKTPDHKLLRKKFLHKEIIDTAAHSNNLLSKRNRVKKKHKTTHYIYSNFRALGFALL